MRHLLSFRRQWKKATALSRTGRERTPSVYAALRWTRDDSTLVSVRAHRERTVRACVSTESVGRAKELVFCHLRPHAPTGVVDSVHLFTQSGASSRYIRGLSTWRAIGTLCPCRTSRINSTVVRRVPNVLDSHLSRRGCLRFKWFDTEPCESPNELLTSSLGRFPSAFNGGFPLLERCPEFTRERCVGSKKPLCSPC